MYDVLIIGAGVSGAAVARELSRYEAKIAVIEKCEDVCTGTSKANSGICHAGYDAKTGSLMAKLNVEGNAMMEQLSKDLDFEFERTGSLVVCLDEADRPKLKKLLERGIANKVPDLRIVEREELLELEPNISDSAVCALFAPTAGIVCPFGLNIALAENAADNGVTFIFDEEVVEINRTDDYWTVKTQIIKTVNMPGFAATRMYDEKEYKTKAVVNAAGVYADEFHNMVSADKINITPRKGEYYLLDRAAGGHVSRTIFQLPSKFGKGVLITPTTHGNLLVGPTADDIGDKEGVNTTMEGLEKITRTSGLAVKNIPLRSTITSFAGLRAHEDGHEFIIGEVKDAEGFFDCAGIESPGLTASPAIGCMLAGIISSKYSFAKKKNFIDKRKGIIKPKNLSVDEYNILIKEKPAYGRIVCRCESVTEGEIIDSITRTLGAKSLDGVKRRTRAGMGRCQAGFCSPKTMEDIARECGIPVDDVTKSGGDSKIIVGENKDIYQTKAQEV